MQPIVVQVSPQRRCAKTCRVHCKHRTLCPPELTGLERPKCSPLSLTPPSRWRQRPHPLTARPLVRRSCLTRIRVFLPDPWASASPFGQVHIPLGTPNHTCLVVSCLVLSRLVLSCLVLSCLVVLYGRLVLSCLLLSCLVLSCLVSYCVCLCVCLT